MKVGAIGKVPFKTSSNIIQTINGLSIDGSANYGVHAPHKKTPKPEFTGRNLREISFEIKLSKYLGTKKPVTLYNDLIKYMHEGKPVTFTTGSRTWGYKWAITSLKMTGELFDRKGNLVQLNVSVGLLEYPRPAGVKKKKTSTLTPVVSGATNKSSSKKKKVKTSVLTGVTVGAIKASISNTKGGK